jgi:hypothetical protein
VLAGRAKEEGRPRAPRPDDPGQQNARSGDRLTQLGTGGANHPVRVRTAHLHGPDGRVRAAGRLADPVGEHHLDRRHPHRLDPAGRRFDGPLHTANVRSANRKVLAGVDQHPGTEVLVLDATALARLPITVIEQFAELERELGDRGVTVWVAALPPTALQLARQTPRWQELDQADRLYPTAGAALRAFQAPLTAALRLSPPACSLVGIWVGLLALTFEGGRRRVRCGSLGVS